MKKGVLLCLILACLVIPVASADVFISQPNSLYNVGDKFNITITISSNSNINDFLSVKILCNSTETEIYKGYQNVVANENKIVPVEISLDKSILNNGIGKCFVKANFYNGDYSSQGFEITRKINLDLEISGISFDPGNTFIISGKAVKENEQNTNGIVDISIIGLDSSLSGNVVNGEFMFNYTIPGNAKAGIYNISVTVYEKDNSNSIINEGYSSDIIRVKQISEKVDIALNAQNIFPGNDLLYTILLYDQAGDNVKDDVGVTIYSPDKNIFLQKLIKSGDANSLKIESNYSPGYWKIEAKYGELSGDKLVYVEELQKVSYNVINGTLTIVNEGNVPYIKPVEIKIGEKTKLEELNLDIGQEKKLKLQAPEGEYDISVNDGNKSESLGRVLLTGNSIAVKDLDDLLANNYSIFLWIIAIAILGYFTFKYYKRVSNRSYVQRTPLISKPISLTPSSKKSVGNSEGSRKEVAVVALKINNSSEIDKTNLRETIDAVVSEVKGLGGKGYSDNDFRIFMFSSDVKDDRENNMKVIKLGNRIYEIITNNNRRYSKKIDFGVGLNVGEAIAENVDGAVKFTSVGNTIPIAKRMASNSEGEVLLSDQIHMKSLGKVKVEKNSKGFWKVSRIIDRDRHSGFIDNFRNRNKFK